MCLSLLCQQVHRSSFLQAGQDADRSESGLVPILWEYKWHWESRSDEYDFLDIGKTFDATVLLLRQGLIRHLKHTSHLYLGSKILMQLRNWIWALKLSSKHHIKCVYFCFFRFLCYPSELSITSHDIIFALGWYQGYDNISFTQLFLLFIHHHKHFSRG